MDCAAACSAYVRDGRGEAAARKAPAGKTGFAGSDAVWCGRLPHGSCRSLWSGKPHAAQGPAAQAVFLMDGETPSGSRLAERLLPHGAIVSPCAVVPPSSVRWRSDRKGSSIFHALMGRPVAAGRAYARDD